MALLLGASSASAAALFYGTGAGTLAPAGTISSGGGGHGGGLCALGTNGCGANHASPGTLTGGQITVGSNTGIGNYPIQFVFSGFNALGAIWDVINTTNNLDTSIGTSTIVGFNTNGSGTLNTVVSGNGLFTFDIVDLLNQYASGVEDTLPGVLNGDGLSDPLDSGVSTLSALQVGSSVFSLSITIGPVPEPTSVSLFVGGIAVLGAVRCRRRDRC
jgi:hypothetical protein